jgi:predicted ester cyclase
MSTEENKAIVRRFFDEARSQGDLGVVDEVYAPEFTRHTRRGESRVTPDFLKTGIMLWRTPFPDYRDTVMSMVAEGEWVSAQVLFSGTHTGILKMGRMGPLAPTGRRIEGWEFFLFRLERGKIVEFWVVWDQLDFAEQLGFDVVPPPSPSK